MSQSANFTALDQSNDELRLLELAPGEGDDSIRCTQQVVGLLDDGLEWNALSYVWGDRKEDRHVEINGEKFAVTDNLFDALHEIRRTRAPIRLWVDALCINQHDNVEKTHQVNIMRRIYARCTTCYIWLGRIDNEISLDAARRAFTCIRYLARTNITQKLPPDLKTAPMHKEAAYGLRKMFDSPWWTRIWTVQEAAVPRNCHLLWGPLDISWNLLIEAAQNMTRVPIPQELHDAPLNHFTATIIWLMRAGNDCTPHRGTPPSGMLYRFRFRHSTDPRDKVYAVPGLISQTQTLLPSVPSCDYTLDVATLFKRVTKDLIVVAEDLMILTGRRGETSSIPGLPSWAIDWACNDTPASSFAIHNSCFWHDRAAGKGMPALQLVSLTMPEDDAVLHLQGIFFDHIAIVSPPISRIEGVYDRANVYRTLRKIKHDFRTGKPSTKIHGDEDSLATGSFFKLGPRKEQSVQLVDDWQKNAFYNQSWFITKSGYLGLGPALMEVGDDVWILSGSTTPFALRRLEGRPLQEGVDCVLVGDVLVQSISAGEGVKDRLENIMPVRIH